MRKAEAAAVLCMCGMLITAANQVGATQTDWRNQTWSELEWMTENGSEEGNGKENQDVTDSGDGGEEEWEDESDCFYETEEDTDGETERITETESEEETCQIILSAVRVTEPERYYDGTDRVAVEAQVTGLPEGMKLELEGRAQHADAGDWGVEVICDLEGEACEKYEIIQAYDPAQLQVRILPKPLTLTISNARKSYYTDVTMENLIFEKDNIWEVSGFLEQDVPNGEVPEGFQYPELELDETVLQKESPMYEGGKLIHYRHAFTVKKNLDGSITGNPTANYIFYQEETDYIKGGEVVLSAAPIAGTLDYTIQCTDPSAMWMDPNGTLWVRDGSGLQIVPEKNRGFTDGELISDIQGDGTAEFVLTRKNKKGEIVAESQIRSISWRADREAPQAGWTIDGKQEPDTEPVYLNRDSQMAVSGVTEYGSGLKNVELYAAFGEEKTMSGEALYQSSKSWKKGMQLLLNQEGSCRVWIRLEDMVGNIRYQCSKEIVIDRTAPKLRIENIAAGSANNGEVTPVCIMEDDNLKKDSLRLTLTGCQTGERHVMWKENDCESTEKLVLQMENLPKKREWDDVYTLKAEVSDMAGNHSSREIRFSVNRFGSVYYLGDETRKQTEQFYVSHPIAPKIYEVNVDYLTESGILLGHEGKTRQLKRDVDYTVQKNGDDGTWKEYCYTINADCFQEEGGYYLVCASEDRAWNSQDNRMGKQKIEFAIDKSAPFILLTGIEENGIYKEAERKVILECRDNLALQEVTVWLNGEEMLKNMEEEQEMTLKQKQDWQTIRIVATDKAGNQKDTGEINFWIGEQDKIPKRKREEKKTEQIEPQECEAEENEMYQKEKTGGKSMTGLREKRKTATEKNTGKNWIIMPGIVVFTALLAIFFFRKREN